MLGRIKSNNSGSKVVNGIIEKYLAENETIEANSFVEFVNNINVEFDSVVRSSNSYSYIDVIVLDENRVFITFDDGNSRVCGAVCTILDDGIHTGTTLQLDSDKIPCIQDMVLVSENLVFQAYGMHGSGFTGKLKYNLLKFSDDVITIVCSGNISTPTNASYDVCTLLIDDNRVFVGHQKGGSTSSSNYNYYYQGIICTITEDSVSLGSNVTLNTLNVSNKCVPLGKDKVAIVYVQDYHYYIVICNISENTITKGDALDSGISYSSGGSYELIQLLNDKFMIIFKDGNVYKTGVIFIEDNNIAKSTLSFLYESNISTYQSLLLDKEQQSILLIPYSSSSVNALTIVKNAITEEQKTSIPYNSYMTFAILNKNRIVTITKENYKPALVVSSIDIRIKQSTSKIAGLTKTKITTTQQGDVWLLNNESEVV